MNAISSSDDPASHLDSDGQRQGGNTAVKSRRRVLVTRPLQDAQRWVQRLQQQGFNAQALPLIDITSLSDTRHQKALAHAWRHLGDYAACMFVSGNAVEHFFKQKEGVAQVANGHTAIKSIASSPLCAMLPPALRCLAPGPGTVAALLAAGVPASQIDAPAPDAVQFDSEALWAVVGARNWSRSRVLLVRGLGSSSGEQASPGRDWIVRQFQNAGASVDTVSVYQRCAPLADAAQLQQLRLASGDGSIWIFSSSESVVNLLDLLQAPVSDESVTTSVAGVNGFNGYCATAIATHPRIAATLMSHGWSSVTESRPALADIVDTLAVLTASSSSAAW